MHTRQRAICTYALLVGEFEQHVDDIRYVVNAKASASDIHSVMERSCIKNVQLMSECRHLNCRKFTQSHYSGKSACLQMNPFFSRAFAENNFFKKNQISMVSGKKSPQIQFKGCSILQWEMQMLFVECVIRMGNRDFLYMTASPFCKGGCALRCCG